MTSEIESRTESRLVGGKYRLESKVGSGAMGSVYRATQLSLNRPVALKLLRREALSTNSGHERFVREAQLLTRLSHPNIVTVYDVELEGEEPYIAMELVAGSTLMDLLESPADFPRRDPVAIARGLAAGLAYIHSQGVLHRDIKPGNILLKDSRHPMLADFGLSKAETSAALTTEGFVVGTPAYLAPEQLMTAVYNERTDLYQLGLVLYEVIVGKLFIMGPGPGLQKIITMRLEGRIPDLLKAAPRCPPALARAVMRCLAKDPGLRFSKAEELERELEELPTASSEGVSLEGLAVGAHSGRRTSATRVTSRTQMRQAAGSGAVSRASDQGEAGEGRRKWRGVASGVMGLIACVAGALVMWPAGREGPQKAAAPSAAKEVPAAKGVGAEAAGAATAEARLQDVDWSYDQESGRLKLRCKVSNPVVVGYTLDGKETKLGAGEPSSQVEVEFPYEASKPFRLGLLRGDSGKPIELTQEDLTRDLRAGGARLTHTLRDFWRRTGLTDQGLVDRLREVVGTRGVAAERRGGVSTKVAELLDHEWRIREPIRSFLRIAPLYFSLAQIPASEQCDTYRQLAGLTLADSFCQSAKLPWPFGRELAASLGSALQEVGTVATDTFENYVLLPKDSASPFEHRVALGLPRPPTGATLLLSANYHFRSEAVLKVDIDGTPFYFSRKQPATRVSRYALTSVWAMQDDQRIPGWSDTTADSVTTILSHSLPGSFIRNSKQLVTCSIVYLQRPTPFDHNVLWRIWFSYPLRVRGGSK